VDTLIPLGLILNELISNALKYAFTDREEGKIHIEIDQKEEGLKVLVEDDGVGMPPGFQTEQTDSLGFKLVRAFVDKMKAQMEVLSQEGTRVSIFLPHRG
jgi:two-component sensor histidine kinase